ncbi:hypothetical protein ABZ894_26045 [Nocardia beijingensis]|uniref:hypothetical protein n=1 Tax=Nocardia beijingensis TaxID=95162 RepID=UPI0033F14CCC
MNQLRSGRYLRRKLCERWGWIYRGGTKYPTSTGPRLVEVDNIRICGDLIYSNSCNAAPRRWPLDRRGQLLLSASGDRFGKLLERQRRRIADADAGSAATSPLSKPGVDPQALVAAMNAAQADKAAAQAELQSLPNVPRLSEKEIYKPIDSLGDIAAVLAAGARADKANLYQARVIGKLQPRTWRVIVGVGVGQLDGGVEQDWLDEDMPYEIRRPNAFFYVTDAAVGFD